MTSLESFLDNADNTSLFRIKRAIQELYEAVSENEGRVSDTRFQSEYLAKWFPKWVAVLDTEIDQAVEVVGD